MQIETIEPRLDDVTYYAPLTQLLRLITHITFETFAIRTHKYYNTIKYSRASS